VRKAEKENLMNFTNLMDCEKAKAQKKNTAKKSKAQNKIIQKRL
jgi:hypothetical protein